jgi:excisionase family DNA binding protein
MHLVADKRGVSLDSLKGAPMQKVFTVVPSDLSEDRVLSYSEVTAVTNCSADTIRRAVAREELKLTRLGPRRVGVRKSELRRWLDACSA